MATRIHSLSAATVVSNGNGLWLQRSSVSVETMPVADSRNVGCP